jgi:L-malate glycosyltransferase
MHIVLSGPLGTDLLREVSGLSFAGAPEGQGGPGTVFVACELAKLGIKVTIVTLQPGATRHATFSDGGITIEFCPMRPRQRDRALDLFKLEIAGLTDAIRRANGDLVHAHWTYEYAEAAVRSPYPHLVTMRDIGWENLWLYRDAYRAFRLLMKLRVMPRVRNLSVVAPFMAKKARHYGYFGPVTIIPNGVLLPEFDESQLHARLTHAPRLVTIGDRSRRKNVKASIAAFRIVRERSPDAELHLFGGGLDSNFARQETGVVGHGKVGHAELMQFLSNRATLLIHPSLQECCPNIVEEAKARGLPVVGGEHAGGVPYVCGTNAGCRLVDITDPIAIAEAATDLLSDRERYLHSSRLARADAEARFAPALITKRYRAKYAEILGLANLS